MGALILIFKRKTALSIILTGVLFLCLTFSGNAPLNKGITCVKAAEAECEIEPDDSINTASVLNLNIPCIGSLKDENDVDFYKFNITEDGTVSISFKHKIINVNENAWDISIYNSTGTLISFYSSALNEETVGSDKLFLPAGEYTVKIERDVQEFNDAEYEININFIVYDEYLEREPDDNINDAFPVDLNRTYAGKLEMEADVDCFKLSINKNGNLIIDFKHGVTSRSEPVFNIEIIDKSNNKCGEFTSNGDKNEIKYKINLMKGDYYLVIKKGVELCSLDYSIYVSYEESKAVYETEPDNSENLANTIILNNVYSGKLNYNEDIDYYKFFVPNCSNAAIYFEHKEFSGGNLDISLLDSSANLCLNFKANGDEVITKCNFSIPAGTYYISIKGTGCEYTDDYKFKITATAVKK